MGKAWTSLPPASLGRPWPAAQIVRLPFLRFWAPGPSRPLQSPQPCPALCECSPSTLGCSPGRCLGPGERPAQTALFWAILSQPPPPFRFRGPVWPAAEAAAGAGQGGRAGVGAPARPFPSAGPPRGLGQLKPQEEEERNQELAGAVWGLSVSRSSEAQEQLPASVMPILRPRGQRPTREAVGQGPGRRSERGTRDRVEQGPREGRGWGWGWRGGRLGCLQGQPWPCRGPSARLAPAAGAGWKDPGKETVGGFCSRPGEETAGIRPPPGTREAPTAFPGQAVFRTHCCVPGGQASTFCLSVALQPLASLSRPSVHLQLLTPSGGLSSLRPQDDTMGFSSELCSPQGHGAVQQMQEAELRLLEGMRKWMAQRVKSDREYAGLLHHMSLQDSGGQSRGIGPHSPISQVGF